MCNSLHNLCSHDAGQDIAEYVVMLAVIWCWWLESNLELGRRPIRSWSDRTERTQGKRNEESNLASNC